MARRAAVGKPETRSPDPQPALTHAYGSERIRAGWIGIGIAAAAFLVTGAAQLSIGAPEVMLAVGPILFAFAALCTLTRRVEVDFARGEAVVTRRLLGFPWTRRIRLETFRRASVSLEFLRPRRSISDGTLAGDQIHAHFTVRLVDPGRVEVGCFHSALDPPAARIAAEALALEFGRRLGIPAERRYRLQQWPDGRLIAAPARRHAEPIGKGTGS